MWGLLLTGLFIGTLVVFLLAPTASSGEQGFPYLSSAGGFLPQDPVMLEVAATLLATEMAPVEPRAAAAAKMAATYDNKECSDEVE
jgi:uncharacterized membrane protein YkgB